MKGILKPGAILDREEISIQDNHYSLSPRQPTAMPHSNDLDLEDQDPDDLLDEGQQAKFYQGTPSEHSVCSDDLTSPEYDPAFDFSGDGPPEVITPKGGSTKGQGQIDPGATFDGHEVEYSTVDGRGQHAPSKATKSKARAVGNGKAGETIPEPKPPIELKDFNSSRNGRRHYPSGENT